MTKASRKHKHKHPARHVKPLPPIKPPKPRTQTSKVLFIAIIGILAAIPFTMGKYTEFNSPGPYDSGAYVYSAAHILDGAEIGVEEKPSAQLGTLLVNILGVWLCGFNETGPKLLQTIFQAAALVLMFIAIRKLFGTLGAAVAVIVASICLSSPLIAKFGNVKEQYMIACMVAGASCFVLYQLGGKWWLALLAGALVSWAPLFKPTGTSVVGAMGLFVIAQPFLKHRTFRQTGRDILLLLAGAAIALGPLYLWIIAWDVKLSLPYSFAWREIVKFLPKAAGPDAKPAADYITTAKQLVSFSEQWPRVLRYYGLLILPIALAIGAIAARIIRIFQRLKIQNPKSQTEKSEFIPKGIENHKPQIEFRNLSPREPKIENRFVLFFAVWWVLDMLFVWISPRSYEQYYLPLNASAAMLGGYLIWVYCEKISRKSGILRTWKTSAFDIGFLAVLIIAAIRIIPGLLPSIEEGQPDNYAQYRMLLSAAVIFLGLGIVGMLLDKLLKGFEILRWYLIGVVGLVCCIVMAWHIFFGIIASPHTGRHYGDRTRGFSQKLNSTTKGPWQDVGEYINQNSLETDKMYVWGWYAGMYVSAQRFSAAAKPVMMPRPAPDTLARIIEGLLAEFEKQRPKFIVASRKRHIPTNRPPYELWPIVMPPTLGVTKPRFLQQNKAETDAYDKDWSKMLRQFDEDEALRYHALKPFREYVMKNYRIVGMFGPHVLFELKNPAPN